MTIKKITLVGPENTGKSSLFNYLVGKNISTVSGKIQTTRDRICEVFKLHDLYVQAIDTGPIVKTFISALQRKIFIHSLLAILDSPIVLIVITKQTRLIDISLLVKFCILKSKYIIFVVNKLDNIHCSFINNFSFNKNIVSIRYISIKQGKGIPLILDDIRKIFNLKKKRDASYNFAHKYKIKVGIVGQTNVGKSTYLNTLLKRNQNITYNENFTTSNPVLTTFLYKKLKILFTDTAGIKANCLNLFNRIFIYFSFNVVKLSNIIFFMTDIGKVKSKEDKKIMNFIAKEYKPCLILINKADLLSPKDICDLSSTRYLYLTLYKFDSKIVSSLNYQHVIDTIPYILMIYRTFNKTINVNILNKVLYNVNLKKKHNLKEGRNIYVYFGKQISKMPMSFIIFSNTDIIKIPYQQYIKKSISQEFKIKSIPIRLLFHKIR
jgi:GTP-binding protein